MGLCLWLPAWGRGLSGRWLTGRATWRPASVASLPGSLRRRAELCVIDWPATALCARDLRVRAAFPRDLWAAAERGGACEGCASGADRHQSNAELKVRPASGRPQVQVSIANFREILLQAETNRFGDIIVGRGASLGAVGRSERALAPSIPLKARRCSPQCRRTIACANFQRERERAPPPLVHVLGSASGRLVGHSASAVPSTCCRVPVAADIVLKR
ncbi:hypothetical protein PR003_g26692 [Phytophthora rubi]|uniref:Uncharacterized protein n=1 Tax=Phytophthora rubi TaxID=129364 RepID=A0A6A4CDH3_9STRA|nr:hypothetical protein PR003_g26692 [Phytophthora rubi]